MWLFSVESAEENDPNIYLFMLINSMLFFKFLFIYFAVLCGMWDLSSLIRDQTCIPCSGSAES